MTQLLFSQSEVLVHSNVSEYRKKKIFRTGLRTFIRMVGWYGTCENWFVSNWKNGNNQKQICITFNGCRLTCRLAISERKGLMHLQKCIDQVSVRGPRRLAFGRNYFFLNWKFSEYQGSYCLMIYFIVKTESRMSKACVTSRSKV